MTKKIVSTLIVITFFMIVGCREVQYYGYEFISQEFLDGELNIGVIGNYGKNYEEGGHKKLDWGFPYNLQFTYVIPSEDDLFKIEIKNIELIGEETHVSSFLGNIENKNPRIYDRGKLIRLSAGPISSDEYSFQNYILNAVIVIYKNENSFEEKNISVLLKTERRTERRSDWFDEVTSV